MKVSLHMRSAYYVCVYYSFFITSKRTKHSILIMLHLNIQEMTKGNTGLGYMHQRIIAPKFTGHELVRTGWNTWMFHCKTCVARGRASPSICEALDSILSTIRMYTDVDTHAVTCEGQSVMLWMCVFSYTYETLRTIFKLHKATCDWVRVWESRFNFLP